jgi:hypothetical protein
MAHAAHLCATGVQATLNFIIPPPHVPLATQRDPSAPLLTFPPREDGADSEAQQQVETLDQMTLIRWIKLFVVLVPLLTPFFSWAIFFATGVDPLSFSLLAMLLMIALYYYFVMVRALIRSFRGIISLPVCYHCLANCLISPYRLDGCK